MGKAYSTSFTMLISEDKRKLRVKNLSNLRSKDLRATLPKVKVKPSNHWLSSFFLKYLFTKFKKNSP